MKLQKDDYGVRAAWVRECGGDERRADHPDLALHWSFFVQGWRRAKQHTRDNYELKPSSSAVLAAKLTEEVAEVEAEESVTCSECDTELTDGLVCPECGHDHNR